MCAEIKDADEAMRFSLLVGVSQGLVDKVCAILKERPDMALNAFSYAVQHGRAEILAVLMEFVPLHLIPEHLLTRCLIGATRPHGTCEKMMRLFLDMGANINAVDTRGTSPLSEAVGCLRKSEVVKMLLDAGADTSEKYLPAHRLEFLIRGPSAISDGDAIRFFDMLINAGCCMPAAWYMDGGFEREMARLCASDAPEKTDKRKKIFSRYFRPQKLL